MPRLSEETKTARRQQIIEAARRCFARKGFAATSMQDIIAESGLSAGSIYSHFDGKADILRQTAGDVLGLAEEFLNEERSGGVASPRTIAELVRARILPENLVHTFLQFWAEAPHDPELAELVRGNLGRVRELLVTALMPWARQTTATAEDAELTAGFYADALMTLMHGYFVRLSVDPAAGRDGLFERLETLLPGD